MDSFGERVRQLRQANVMTQAELAEKAGLSWITVARLETGKGGANPRPATVRALATALKVSPTWLLMGDEGEAKKEAA